MLDLTGTSKRCLHGISIKRGLFVNQIDRFCLQFGIDKYEKDSFFSAHHSINHSQNQHIASEQHAVQWCLLKQNCPYKLLKMPVKNIKYFNLLYILQGLTLPENFHLIITRNQWSILIAVGMLSPQWKNISILHPMRIFANHFHRSDLQYDSTS